MLIVASFEVSMATQMDDSSPHTFIRPGSNYWYLLLEPSFTGL